MGSVCQEVPWSHWCLVSVSASGGGAHTYTRPSTSPLCGSGGWSHEGVAGCVVTTYVHLFVLGVYVECTLPTSGQCHQHVCVRFTFTLMC